MKSVTKLAFASALLSVLAVPAFAGSPAANLNWDDCTAGAAAKDNADPCNANTGAPNKLVISVEPNGAIADVNGAQGIIDIQVDAAALPDFWHLETGGCRAGRLSADVNIGSASAPFSCLEPWSQVGNQAGGANFGFAVNPDRGPAWGRITWIIAVPGVVTLDTNDGSEFYIIGLNMTKTGTTTCAGCTTPACLVANQVRLTKPAQIPGGDVFIETAGTGGYHVTWQGGGTLACPASTPVHNKTWGQVKHLYR